MINGFQMDFLKRIPVARQEKNTTSTTRQAQETTPACHKEQQATAKIDNQ